MYKNSNSIPTPPVSPDRIVKSQNRNDFQYPKSLAPGGMKYAVLASAVGVSVWAYITFQYSQEDHPNYDLYKHRLQIGWLFGSNRMMDNSDAQYAGFRNNLPILLVVMGVHRLIAFVLEGVYSRKRGHMRQQYTRVYPTTTKTPLQDYALFKRTYCLIFSLVFLSALYGTSILKIIGLTLIPYGVTSNWKKSLVSPIFCWIFSVGILFLNQAYQGYKFASVSTSLGFLDLYQGVGIRWHITFNFTILRIISYSMDQYWAHQSDSTSVLFESHAFDCRDCPTSTADLCGKSRIQKSRPLMEYNIFNYFIYLLYAPLYMAGPIISFNNFMAQMNNPPKSITRKSIFTYTTRLIGAFLLMETMMHLFYVVAIKDSKSWAGFSSLQIFTLGYFNLNFIWLKLLIIWRFFRLWALFDGVETQENMLICMSNNYSGLEFWRGWHASYNRWLIRYLYIPFGGARRRVLNSFLIFTFVAIWHDIELKLLAWGWLIVLFILPEMVCLQYFCTPKMRQMLGHWHLQLCAFGGLLSIWMMMTANLVGFAVGIDGMVEMSSKMLQLSGFLEMIFVSVILFSFVHVQFYHRSISNAK